MFATKRRLLAAVLTLSACAVNPAPPHALPDASGALHDAYGAFVVAELGSGKPQRLVQGELIAASEDSLWVLSQGGLNGLARDTLRKATVSLFEQQNGAYTAWVVLGTLATASNGILLVITAPMWLIAGNVTLAMLSKQPLYRWSPDRPLKEIAPFARFPGGIPEGLDRSKLVLLEKMRQ